MNMAVGNQGQLRGR